ncbi:MAG: phosphoglucosamine mutase [Gammaproteobacteria bacterium]|nr:phosphoglucosamine mutase [Gammaproteobacteria bacterium]
MTQQRRYFGTDGIRGRVGVIPIIPDFILKLGWAVGRVLANGGGSKVLIGKDTRISGYMFESALEAGLSAAGVDIHLLGPMPTPAIAYLTRTLRAQAGIVISASHNTFQDNGIKFFAGDGKKLADELELKIEAELEKPLSCVASQSLGRAVRIDDAAGRYIEFCKSSIPSQITLKGLKVVVDCANGATYHIAPNVLHELGATVVKLSTLPDGLNINHDCGATNPVQLSEVVKAEQADVGIALDGDGDRVIMVDHRGELLDGDQLIYIIAKYLQQSGQLQGGVVGTIMSNFGLENALNALGIGFARSKVGDRYVLSELLKRQWILGGEPSGHIIHLDLNTTGDGIIAALQVLAVMISSGRSLFELKSQLNKWPQKLVSVNSHETIVDLEHDTTIQKAMTHAQQRLNGHGRVLLRYSGTEPVIRIMVESENQELVTDLTRYLEDAVRSRIVV